MTTLSDILHPETLKNYCRDEMTPKERLRAALYLQKIDRIPLAQPLQTGTVELMQACGSFWPKAHREADSMARLAYAAHSIIGFESVRVPFDLNVESEALGCTLDYVTGPGNGIDVQPSVRLTPVNAKEHLARLSIPDPSKTGRMPAVIQAVQMLGDAIKKVGNEIPIFAATVAPFTLAGQIRGVDKFMRDLIKDPAFAHELLEKCYQTCLIYAKALVAAGADTLVLIDPTASPDLVSPKYYGEFAKLYTRRITEQLNVPTILHICGNSQMILSQMAEVSNGVSVDSQVDMQHLKQVLGNKAAAVGNIDVNSTLLFGSKTEIEQCVVERIKAGTDILTTACGIAPRTPSRNLIVMVQAGKKYGQKQA
ncbi:MAG: MtaA/CmuA family methyltransferase [Peptococcaceae bacterium]|nr:MtaA/CmuA family methyltransferase [Peptococcaceae bacterium]